MIADVLLRPDNRLLGGATGDFSLFGGQPTPGVTFARQSDANGHVSIAAPAANSPAQEAPATAAAATSSPAASSEEISAMRGEGGGALMSVTPSVHGTPTPGGSAHATDNLVPMAMSGGGLVMSGLAALGLAHSIPAPSPATAESTSSPLAPTSTGFEAPTLDPLVPQIGTLIATVAPIAGVVSDLADAATPVTQAVANDVVDPIASGVADAVDTVDTVLAPVTEGVAPVVADVVEAVAPVTGGIAAVAAPAIATVADVAMPVGTALGTTVATAAPVVATVTPAIDPVVDAVTDTVSPVATAAAPATAPIVDAIQPAGVVAQPAAEAITAVAGEALGGSDPEGGVQTLVGMVANAEAFDVIAPGSASPEEPSASVIDDLIGDASEVAPLLGDLDDAHHDDGPDLFGGHGLG